MIALLTPTRKRPAQFKAMMRSALVMAAQPHRVVVVPRVDYDDNYEWESSDNLRPVIGARTALSGLWTECAEAAPDAAILMQCADDIRFRTPGWDTLVRDAIYADPWRYVYGRDGVADERMATHGFMHRRWFDTLGYFTWPHFTSDYGDLWNHTIAEKLGKLHFIEELYTEHLHPAVGKAEMDQTHRERVERDHGGINEKRWEAVQGELDHAVELLRAAAGGHNRNV